MYQAIENLPTAFFLKRLAKDCILLLLAMGTGSRKYRFSKYSRLQIIMVCGVPEIQGNQQRLFGAVHCTEHWQATPRRGTKIMILNFQILTIQVRANSKVLTRRSAGYTLPYNL